MHARGASLTLVEQVANTPSRLKEFFATNNGKNFNSDDSELQCTRAELTKHTGSNKTNNFIAIRTAIKQ